MSASVFEKYLDAAKKHGAASRDGDHKAANKAHKTLMMALKELRAEPDKGVDCLNKLLAYPDSFVICWAATHLLPLSEEKAKAALQSLAEDETDLAAFNAKMVLREWDAGRLKVE